MKLFTLRKPPLWGVLIAGVIFGALWVYALKTNTFMVPPSRTSHGKVILKSQNPEEFAHWLRISAGIFISMTSLALFRINLIEDRMAALAAKIRFKAAGIGASTKPAPVWAYVFLAAFVSLVCYVGYIFMYKE